MSPSGDGHGRRDDAYSIPGGSADLPYLTPRLAGDVRPSFPVYGDGLGPYPGSGDGHGRRVEPQAAAFDYEQAPPWMGDGHGNGRAPLPAVALAQPGGLAYPGEQLFAQPPQMSARVAQSTPKAELWKLLMLVIFFVIWISTASTLLFLYMDRYLFPG